MRVSSDSERQSTDLQRDALLDAGVDVRHLFEDQESVRFHAGLPKGHEATRKAACPRTLLTLSLFTPRKMWTGTGGR
jgi:hypothetical protein